MKSPTLRAIDQIIARGPAPYLKTQGFRKQGRTFARRIDDLYQVVTLQASQWNTPSSVSFTADLGLTWPYFHEMWTGAPFPPNPGSAAQILAWRLGKCMTVSADHWWEVTPESNIDVLSTEIVTLLTEQGLPFLDTHTNFDQILRVLEQGRGPRDGIIMDALTCRAILLTYLHRPEEACKVLAQQQRRSIHLKIEDTAALFRQRLGLECAG